MKKVNNIKKAALVSAVAVLGAVAPVAAKDTHVTDDTQPRKEIKSETRRVKVGTLLRQETTDYKKLNNDGNIIAYYLDTDNDGLPDTICYKVAKMGEVMMDYPLGTKIEVTEVRDENNSWVVSDIVKLVQSHTLTPNKTR